MSFIKGWDWNALENCHHFAQKVIFSIPENRTSHPTPHFHTLTASRQSIRRSQWRGKFSQFWIYFLKIKFKLFSVVARWSMATTNQLLSTLCLKNFQTKISSRQSVNTFRSLVTQSNKEKYFFKQEEGKGIVTMLFGACKGRID